MDIFPTSLARPENSHGMNLSREFALYDSLFFQSQSHDIHIILCLLLGLSKRWQAHGHFFGIGYFV